MSCNNNRLEFKLGEDDWETFIERLELYFVSTGITDDNKQAAILLTRVNPETYMLIRDLCAPAKPKEKTLAELVKLVSDHLCPKPSEAMERFNFHQAKQSGTESVAEFVARLKKLSLHCNFEKLNDAIRDQLVCGIRDHETKVLLFKEEGLTLDKAIKTATAQQDANCNAEKAEKITEGTGVRDVHAIRSDQGRRFQDGKRSSKGKQSKKSRGSETQGRPQKQRTTNEGRTPRCYCCGQENHYARDCVHRYKVCNYCKTKGHLQAACRKAKSQTVKYCESESNTSETKEPEDDFFAIRENVFALNDFDDPLFVDVKINGVNVRMEHDSGSRVTIIPESVYNEYFVSVPLEPAYVKFNLYGGSKLKPISKMTGLTVKLGSKSKTLDCCVTRGSDPPIMGRQWLAAFGLWPLHLEIGENMKGKSTRDKKKESTSTCTRKNERAIANM